MFSEFPFLLPLWEKVARTQSVPDEGSFSADEGFSSAERDPSTGCRGGSDRSHKGRGGPERLPSPPDQLQPLILGQDLDAVLLGLRQFRAGAGTGDDVIR